MNNVIRDQINDINHKLYLDGLTEKCFDHYESFTRILEVDVIMGYEYIKKVIELLYEMYGPDLIYRKNDYENGKIIYGILDEN